LTGVHYDQQVFIQQLPIAKRFTYHFVYYRALHKAYREKKLQSEFWSLTIDAPLLQAIICWCMVFGSGGCNPTHWKHLSPTNSDELQKSFRNGLFRDAELNEKSWSTYWKEITDFRNSYVAHRELNSSLPVPNLDTALKVALYYDYWIREVISPDTFDEPSLETFISELHNSTILFIDKIFGATRERHISTS
jgi:hypothetical protein